MPLLPIAAFLAGALLSLLLPVSLLIALTVWYVMFVRRVPETHDEDRAVSASSPGPAAEAAGPSSEAP